MKMVTNRDAFVVKIQGAFTWEEFCREFKEFSEKQEIIMSSPRTKSRRGEIGWIIRINSIYVGDIKAWPTERQRWVDDAVDVVSISNLKLTVTVDAGIPVGVTQWEYHWSGTL